MCSEDKGIVNSDNYTSRQELFDAAGQIAIAQSKAQGLSITYAYGDKIIEESPEGEKVVIGVAPPKVRVNHKRIRLK